jgi:hypothetical protein
MESGSYRQLRGFMDHQVPNAAPDAGSGLRFIASIMWRAKWLIAAATFAAAAVTFALYPPSKEEAWTGKTTLAIGVAPPVDYVLQRSGPPLEPIETPRNFVARMFDPVFRSKIVNEAVFAPSTAALSRAMVSSSLRGTVGESDRDVAIELTASSAADVQAALRALAAEVGKVHGDIFNQRLRLLQSRIDDAKSRLAVIEKISDRMNDRIFDTTSDDKTAMRPTIVAPNSAASIPAWNELQDRILSDTNLAQLSEPSVLHLEANSYPLASRSVGTLRASLLAGLVMLAAMIVLTIVVSPPTRVSPD